MVNTLQLEGLWLTSLSQERQKELLEKHKAFWRQAKGSSPIIGYAPSGRMFPLNNLSLQHEGILVPGDITDEIIVKDAKYRPVYLEESDLFPAKIPLEPMAWSEAYCGTKIYASTKSQTIWSDEVEKIPESLEDLKNLIQETWRDKLLDGLNTNVRYNEGNSLISETLVRGPADVLAALVGVQQFCFMLADRPVVVLEMLNWLADRVIELYEAQFSVLPRFCGGTVNRYGLWAEGKNIVTQADVSSLVSPDCFREVFVPAYRRIVHAFDNVSIHFHSCAAQHVEALLEIDELAAIEWAMDPNGPTLKEMIPVFARIMESKPIIIMNIHTDDEQKMLLDELPQEGLCVIRRTQNS